MNQLPELSKDLILQLNEEIPEKTPTPSQDLSQIMFYAGKRHVINYLLMLLNQDENSLYEEKGG